MWFLSYLGMEGEREIVLQHSLTPVHYRKPRGTRQTIIIATKISCFVEIFGLYVKVERDLDDCTHVSHPFTLK